MVTLFVLLPYAAPSTFAQVDSLSHESEISLITIQPGSPIYSRWGHSAIHVFDPVNDLDLNFNYGTFEFEDPNFVGKFVKGKLNYYLSANRYDAATRHYSTVEERSVIKQSLDLNLQQRQAIFDFLVDNIQPENKYYLYDFLFDNCSTRIRDAFVAAVPDVRFPEEEANGRSHRALIRDYGKSTGLLDVGMQLLLGSPTNRESSNWDATFLPDSLLAFFEAAEIQHADGTRKLVSATDTVYWSGRETTTSNIWVVVLWVAALLFAVLSFWRRSKSVLILSRVMVAISGVFGCLIIFMWFGTDHMLTRGNFNLAWALPTHLVAALFWKKAQTKTYLTFAVAVVLILLLAQLFPIARLSIASAPLALVTGISLVNGLLGPIAVPEIHAPTLPDAEPI